MMQQPRVGIGVLILDHHNRLLLGQRKNAHGEATWSPPGGHLEFGEDFEDCAQREILEETGLHIDNVYFYELTNDVFIEEKRHYVSILMMTRCPSNQTPQACEPDKTDSWHWFELDHLPSNIFLPLQNLFKKRQSIELIHALEATERR